MKKVGVVGCGLMGCGIVEVSIKTGHETVVREINQECLDRGLGRGTRTSAAKAGKLQFHRRLPQFRRSGQRPNDRPYR